MLREMRPEGFEPPTAGLEIGLEDFAEKPRSTSGQLRSRILSLIADRCKRRDFLARNVVTERLSGKKVVVTGPVETAATRIDWAAWLRSLSRRPRTISSVLAGGETTQVAARRFHLSPA
jgi:hypothetical protein